MHGRRDPQTRVCRVRTNVNTELWEIPSCTGKMKDVKPCKDLRKGSQRSGRRETRDTKEYERVDFSESSFCGVMEAETSI